MSTPIHPSLYVSVIVTSHLPRVWRVLSSISCTIKYARVWIRLRRRGCCTTTPHTALNIACSWRNRDESKTLGVDPSCFRFHPPYSVAQIIFVLRQTQKRLRWVLYAQRTWHWLFRKGAFSVKQSGHLEVQLRFTNSRHALSPSLLLCLEMQSPFQLRTFDNLLLNKLFDRSPSVARFLKFY